MPASGVRARARCGSTTLAVEELALVNVLRRPGCPLSVKSADGKTIYEEGRDFEPVIDPKLGHVPWEGEFEFDHAGPAIKITPRSRIKNGDSLRVSWYHPVITHGSQVMCCLSEPKLEKILVDQARAAQRAVSPQDVFHVARRDPGGELVPGLSKPQADARSAPGRERAAMHGDPRKRSTRRRGSSSGRTCSIRTIMPSTSIIWSMAR